MNAVAHTKPIKRCAVYCRVSTDERLDQEFNSIDAQKESGRAFVASQRSEGWVAVGDDYDDPGYSGGNTERPALKRLMADIEAKRVDIVVVYKIDRLTRSLADFSKMVEVFERHGVSFVSVTQQFNTTTSMGRLTLNILLSFAQFEREVTGERIRDKIAASKKKGLWMGGVPALGYDVENRRLVINEREAELVRRIFRDMLATRSITRISEQLFLEGITTKAWTTQKGKSRLGVPMDKKHLNKILRNRIYLGELSHKGSWVPGSHPALLDRELFDAVQAMMDARVRTQPKKSREAMEALLRGLLYAPSGEKMYPTWARKNGKQYRYYVSRGEARYGARGKAFARIPAAEIEPAVVAQMRSVLTSPEAIAAVVQKVKASGTDVDEAQVVLAFGRLDDVWDRLFPAERARIASLMIERIDIVQNHAMQGVRVKWHELGWDRLIGEFAPETIGAELVEEEA